MFVLKFVAALWAAENMDEKKLVPVALPGSGPPSSAVGDKGDAEMLESLLGPTAAEADVLLL